MTGETGPDDQGRVISRRRWWLQTALFVLVAVVLAMGVRSLVAEVFRIPSDSMRPTLERGDRILVSKLGGDPAPGDIVVFSLPGEEARSRLPGPLGFVAESLGIAPRRTDLVKRVVAVEGQTVEISDGRLLVDGVAVVERYLAHGTRLADFGPLTVPSGQVFVLGDNRNESRDSRAYGPVPTDRIIGTAVRIVWPPGRWAGL